MGLETYQKKRDFTKTSEPSGRPRKRTTRPRRAAPAKRRRKAAKPPMFVVQKHAALRLHYDFRLELDGVLKSWAVPKGPSLDPKEKRLAIQVEDHPLDYAKFEGTIPKGEYGGGTVMVWDRGQWSPLEDPREGLAAGRLKFTLDGEKLRGGWTLVRFGGRKSAAGEKNWLLIKERDEAARPSEEINVEEAFPLSAATGRDFDEIASDAAAKTVAKTT